jgi:hypothetical protein
LCEPFVLCWGRWWIGAVCYTERREKAIFSTERESESEKKLERESHIFTIKNSTSPFNSLGLNEGLTKNADPV